jgi:hypothetical protein
MVGSEAYFPAKEKPVDNIPNHTVLRQAFHWLRVTFKDIFSDHYAKKLHTGQTILLYVDAMMNQRKSNDAIAEHLSARKWLQEWIQLDSIEGSSLYRKLEHIPLYLVKDIFEAIIQAIAQHYAGKSGIGNLGKLSVIDSTEIKLPAMFGVWAYLSTTQNAIKMHTCLEVVDKSSVCAKKVVLSTAAVADHDAEVMNELVVESLNTYVFDRGYINYSHYQRWLNKNIRYVARIKTNNTFRILEKRENSESSTIILDADVEFTDSKTKEVFRLRLVEYTYLDKNGKIKKIRVVTNRWDSTAEEISEIYRYRWQIEIFFKWLKQHAHLKKLYNTKPEAVRIQIYLSLITHALCELVRLTMKPEKTCWEWLQLINLYAGEELKTMLSHLQREPKHTSKGRQKKAKKGRPRKTPKKLKAIHLIIK